MVTAAKGKVGGTVYIAPSGTTLPSDATTALANTYKSLGYTSEDGITRAISKDTQLVKDHHGTVVAVLEGGKTETLQFKCVDATNAEALGLTFGSATGTLAAGMTVKSTTDNTGRHVYVFEEVLSDNSLHRMICPDAVITSIGNITYKGTDVVAYDLTITAIADSTGTTVYEYFKTPSGG